MSEIDFDWSNERIRTSVDSVEALHRQLYLQADSLGGDARDFYLAPRWPVQQLVTGSYTSRDAYKYTETNLSFMNFILDYIAKQRCE